jgi:hypothetical protein
MHQIHEKIVFLLIVYLTALSVAMSLLIMNSDIDMNGKGYIYFVEKWRRGMHMNVWWKSKGAHPAKRVEEPLPCSMHAAFN